MIFEIAKRYVWGKKSAQAIHIISWVSIVAMAIGTAAIIIVMSVFNGFDSFIKGLYSDYYPDIIIRSSNSKNFICSPEQKKAILSFPEIANASFTLEEKVLFTSEQQQLIGVLKGVDEHYDKVIRFSKHIQYGKSMFHDSLPTGSDMPAIVLGLGVSNQLNTNEESVLPINIYAFRKNASFQSLDPSDIYQHNVFQVSGVFLLQDFIDNQYGFARLSDVQYLTDNENQYSALEIKLKPHILANEAKQKFAETLDKMGLVAYTRFEQNKTLYFVLRTERWAVFAILALIVCIASFNIMAALAMLVIDKQRDIAIMKTMGMRTAQIRNIFVLTGVLLSATGVMLGSILAGIVCFIQQRWGFIKLGNTDNFLIQAYPVKMQWTDFILTIITVLCIAAIASYIPAVRAARKLISLRSN